MFLIRFRFVQALRRVRIVRVIGVRNYPTNQHQHAYIIRSQRQRFVAILFQLRHVLLVVFVLRQAGVHRRGVLAIRIFRHERVAQLNPLVVVFRLRIGERFVRRFFLGIDLRRFGGGRRRGLPRQSGQLCIRGRGGSGWRRRGLLRVYVR